MRDAPVRRAGTLVLRRKADALRGTARASLIYNNPRVARHELPWGCYKSAKLSPSRAARLPFASEPEFLRVEPARPAFPPRLRRRVHPVRPFDFRRLRR